MTWSAATIAPKTALATRGGSASPVPSTPGTDAAAAQYRNAAVPAFLQNAIAMLNANPFSMMGGTPPPIAAGTLAPTININTGEDKKPMTDPAEAFRARVARIQDQRLKLGPAPFGMYQGSPQQRLDQQLMDAQAGVDPIDRPLSISPAPAGTYNPQQQRIDQQFMNSVARPVLNPATSRRGSVPQALTFTAPSTPRAPGWGATQPWALPY